MSKQKKSNPTEQNLIRHCMELAVEEMNKSQNEPRPDGKVPPKVGAILLFPDGKIERGHRGELRNGDHAEYTLLERKFGHQNLENCILFTTLEPCVERNPPKVPCCRRTTNARIKTVYIGITDPDPTVDGKGIKHLEKHSVIVKMFDRDLQQIIEEENFEFRKQALERKEKYNDEDDILPITEQVISTSKFEDFSTEALKKFIVESKLNFKIEQPEFQKYLVDLGAFSLDSRSNSLKPTGVGILLFGHGPRLLFKQAVLKAYVDYGDGKIEAADFDQPLVLIPDLVEKWLNKVLPLSKDTTSFKRKDIPDFPIEVLREAVINALVHRDYSIDGAKSSIEIDNEKIVVKSPGGPLPSISLEQLNTFKAPSISRNPIISYVFSLMNYVEEKGFGMKSLRSLNEKFNLPLPEYIFELPFLVLTFPRNMESVKSVSHHITIKELNKDELLGYEFIKLRQTLTRKIYQESLRFDEKKAERHLKKMVELNLIKRLGAGPSVHYEIVSN